MLLTGFRRMEALGLEPAWLDEEEEAIRFPNSESGAQTRVIGRAAVDLLLEQPKTTSPFFFPADWGKGHFIGVVRVLDRVCEKGAAGRRHPPHLAALCRPPDYVG
jgi:integrase